jgi:hypothetical protein
MNGRRICGRAHVELRRNFPIGDPYLFTAGLSKRPQ